MILHFACADNNDGDSDDNHNTYYHEGSYVEETIDFS